MPFEHYSNDSWISHLEEHLKQGKYSSQATSRRIAVAKRFLAYLNQRCIAVETTQRSDINLYLENELRLFHQRHGGVPRSIKDWRSSHTSGIHILLRLVRGQWPPAVVPLTDYECFHRRICEDYAEWLCNVRGLAAKTRFHRSAEARRFLAWLGERGNPENLINLPIVDVRDERVRCIFMLRDPKETIQSLVDLTAKFYEPWTAQQAVDYYVQRLESLAGDAAVLQDRHEALTYHDLVSNTSSVFRRLESFLNLEGRLREEYSIQKFTGKRGDPSQAIQRGRIVRNPKAHSIQIPDKELDRALQAYQACARAIRL